MRVHGYTCRKRRDSDTCSIQNVYSHLMDKRLDSAAAALTGYLIQYTLTKSVCCEIVLDVMAS